MPHTNTANEDALLRTELEMLMAERQNLLRIAGAAAAFVAELDIKALPEATWEAAELLSGALNALQEDTLQEALGAVKAETIADSLSS